jgi:hypothetical protein
MGTNDHLPSKQNREPSRRRRKAEELLDWSMADPATLASLVGVASIKGAYIAFGAAVPPTCLLLYVRSGDWKERIAIENRDDINGTLADVLDDFEALR